MYANMLITRAPPSTSSTYKLPTPPSIDSDIDCDERPPRSASGHASSGGIDFEKRHKDLERARYT